MVELVVIIAAAVFGIALGVFVQRHRSRQVIQQAQAIADRVLEEARRSAELTKQEMATHSKAKAFEVQRAFSGEAEAYENERALIVERLTKREARLQRRTQETQERQTTLDRRRQSVRDRQHNAKQRRIEAKELRGSWRERLEERAGQPGSAVVEQIGATMIAECRSRSADKLRNFGANSDREFDRIAKRIIGMSLQRYTEHYARERSGANIALEPPQLERLQGPHAEALEQLKEMSGAGLVFSDDGSLLRIESAEAAVRELCRRAVTRFLDEGKIRDPERLIQSIRRELDAEIVDRGKRAFKILELEPAAPAVSELLGKLNWRTSYAQNQYWHSVEAAHLAGLMAAELGLDVRVARRAALLHDIGKSLPTTEGSHALLGGAIARESGEIEPVVNAIESHHGEQPTTTPYAWLATAADALSGGRPGARREIAETYSDRIGDLERIAAAFRGVQVVHAVQAGRELRIHVDEKGVRDGDLAQLSENIAQKISDEVVFPGQVRVTVIREFKHIAEAR